MTLPSYNSLIAMLLMLMIGVGLGMLIMTSHHSSVHAVVEAPQAAAAPALGPAVRPIPEPVAPEAPTPQAPDQYVGVIFARQLVDMAARSDGRLAAVHVHLGDHLKPGNVIAQLESSAIRQQLEMAEASLRSAQAEARSTNVELKDGVDSMSREVVVEAKLHVPAAWRGQMKPGLSGYVVATSGQRSVAAPGELLKSALQAR
jgi:multidrug efflux pump subunit AcrA (membrane-fusion protein)